MTTYKSNHDLFVDVFRALGGKRGISCSRQKFCMMLSVLIGEVTTDQLYRTTLYSTPNYCRTVLHDLEKQGYLQRESGAVPSIFDSRSRSADLYLPTETGRAYVTKFTDDLSSKRSIEREESLYSKEYAHLLHTLSENDVFYHLVPYIDRRFEFYFERRLNGAYGFRPDLYFICPSVHTSTVLGEVDTGSEPISILQGKFTQYADYLKYGHVRDMSLIFYIDDRLMLKGKIPPVRDYSAALSRIIRSDFIPVSDVSDDLRSVLPVRDDGYTADELKDIVKNLRKSHRENRKDTVRIRAIEAYEQRFVDFYKLTGLEPYWKSGIQTSVIPLRYATEYYWRLCPSLDKTFMEAAGTLGIQKLGWGQFDDVTCRSTGDGFAVEDISVDLSGIYRAKQLLTKTDMILICNSLSEGQEFLKDVPHTKTVYLYCDRTLTRGA